MSAKQIVASLAVGGALAAFAFVNMNALPSGSNFLATPLAESEMEFINFIS